MRYGARVIGESRACSYIFYQLSGFFKLEKPTAWLMLALTGGISFNTFS